MRIGFFTDTYLPVKSGMELAIETFRSSLERLGNEMHVFATTMRDYHDTDANIVRFHSMYVLMNPEIRLGFPWAVGQHRVARVVRTPLDVVHAHSPSTIGIIGMYTASKQRIPLVYTNHTDFVEYAKVYLRLYAGLPVVAGWIARKLVTWFANASDLVITPSTKFKRLLEEYGVKSRIEVLQTGINVERFTRTPDTSHLVAIRERWHIPSSARVLMYVGRINEEKNIEFLIRAYAEIERAQPDTYMFFIGSGRHSSAYQALATSLGITHAIFTGVVPHADIPLYYHASDLFLFASKTDTQGIVILEAMATGLPVVALEDDALKDVMHQGVQGVFVDVNASPQTFAQETITLLNDTQRRERLGAAGRLRAGDFTELIQATRLLQLYDSAIAAYADSPRRESASQPSSWSLRRAPSKVAKFAKRSLGGR